MNLVLNLSRHYYYRLLLGLEATHQKKNIPWPDRIMTVKKNPWENVLPSLWSGGGYLNLAALG